MTQDIFEKAVKSFTKKNFKDAEIFFNQILKKQPNHIDSIFYLSMVALKIKNFALAKELSQKAIKIKPNYVMPYHNLGQALYGLGESKKAINFYNKAIEIDQNFLASYNNLGNILKEIGENKKAENCFLNVIRINPKLAVAYNNLGTLYQEMGKKEKAIDYFKKAIKINNNFLMAYYNLGKLYKELKNYNESIKYFKISNTIRSRAELLESIYFGNNLKLYIKTLKELSKKDSLNLRIATISAYVSEKENIKNIYSFCRKPLNYVFVKNLESEIKFPEKFSLNLSKILKNQDLTWQPASKSTKGGYHTHGNLFNLKDYEILQLQKLINKQIEIFKKKYKSNKDFFITKWPKKYHIEAWHVKLMQKGFQKPHIHPAGWLSGCFYIKIPKSLKKDEGAIKFTLSGYDYPFDKNLPNYTHIPKVFDIALFPSSLFHETIPFASNDERHVIAFDIMPK